MPVDISMPLNRIGTVYADWEKAPKGALIVFGEMVATGQNQNWERVREPRIGMAVETAMGDTLMVISPKPVLVFPHEKSRTMAGMFEALSLGAGPVVDISTTHELVLQKIQPCMARADLEPGDVVCSADQAAVRMVMIGFPGYAGRAIALDGDAPFKMVDLGAATMIRLGKLGVAEKTKC